MTDPIMTNFVRKDRPQPSDPDYVPMSAAYATSVGGTCGRGGTADAARQPAQQIAQTLREAGAGVILKPSRGEHGTVFVTGRDGGPGAVPTVTLERRALQHDRGHAGAECSGEAARQRADEILRRRRRQRLQRDRGAARAPIPRCATKW